MLIDVCTALVLTLDLDTIAWIIVPIMFVWSVIRLILVLIQRFRGPNNHADS
jgi:uncharacterized membrane protein